MLWHRWVPGFARLLSMLTKLYEILTMGYPLGNLRLWERVVGIAQALALSAADSWSVLGVRKEALGGFCPRRQRRGPLAHCVWRSTTRSRMLCTITNISEQQKYFTSSKKPSCSSYILFIRYYSTTWKICQWQRRM